jgi:outer membrane protein TolC
MKLTGIPVVCLALSALTPVQASGLSLKEAQESLLSNNLDIVSANQDYGRKSYEEAEAKAAWWPSLDVVGSYNYFTEKNTITFPNDGLSGTPLAGLAGRSLSMGNNYRAEAGVDLVYPLTSSLVNIYNVRYRRLGLRTKDAQNAGLRNQLSFRLGAMYFAWILSYGQTDVYRKLVDQLAEQATQARNLSAGGVSSNSKVLDALARLAAAKADLVTAQNQCDSLRFEIVNFTRCKDSAVSPEDYSFGLDSEAVAALDTVGLNVSRPELRAVDLVISQQSALSDIISGQKYPNLVASLGYRYGNPGLKMGGTEFMNYGQVGLQLKWSTLSLFGWSASSSQQKQVSYGIESAKYQKQQMVDAWENAIRNAKLQVTRAMRQRDAARAALTAAEAVSADAKNSLAAGVATQTDVLNALTARARADLSVRQAEFMKNMAILQLYFAAGREISY